MICFDEASTLADRSFTASATTPKPRPASPARPASTEALNATRRVCSAICVICPAAAATWRSVSTMPPTSVPTCSTAARARSTAFRLSVVVVPMPPCARCTSPSWLPSVCSAWTWRWLTWLLSSIRPRTSAASRPRREAAWAMLCTAWRRSGAGAATGAGSVAAAALGVFLNRLSMVVSCSLLFLGFSGRAAWRAGARSTGCAAGRRAIRSRPALRRSP